ncbi:hypothetical protein [Streptomyces sp. MN13]
MTVGVPRKELEGLPDDTALTAYVTSEPGGETVSQRVVAGRARSWLYESRPEGAVATEFELLIDYPPGTCTRRVWRR